MTAQVRFAPLARLQVGAIEAWWREHREAAPNLFSEELAEALELVSRNPRAGTGYRYPRGLGVRRFILRTARYHVYYRVEVEVLHVLAVWSAVRGRGPDLWAIE